MKYRALLAGFFVLAGAGGCFSDAPRDNPFDPQADDFQSVGSVQGQVTNRLGRAVPGARIELHQDVRATTDAQGSFRLPRVPADSVSITAAKDGYAPDSASVQVEVGEQANVLLQLNALPVFDSVSVRSAHVQRFVAEPTNLYQLEVEAQVSDPDELPGLDSVMVTIPSLGVQEIVEREATGERYVQFLRPSELPVESLHDLVGRRFFLVVRDQEDNVARSAPQYLTRVIEPSPQALQGRVEGDSVQFQWRPSVGEEDDPYPFEYTYRVSVYRTEGGFERLQARYENIVSDSTSLRAPAPDVPSSSYWTVAVVDAFGNWSRSKESGFEVVE